MGRRAASETTADLSPNSPSRSGRRRRVARLSAIADIRLGCRRPISDHSARVYISQEFTAEEDVEAREDDEQHGGQRSALTMGCL